MSTATTATSTAPAPVKGMRKNGTILDTHVPCFFVFSLANVSGVPAGKNWHDAKKPFRPAAGMTSYAKRQELRKQHEAIKEHERELKEEKEAERQVSIHCYVVTVWMLITDKRPISKGSRNAEPQRRKRNDTTRWQRRCTTSGLNVSSGKRSATSCSTHDPILLEALPCILSVCTFCDAHRVLLLMRVSYISVLLISINGVGELGHDCVCKIPAYKHGFSFYPHFIQSSYLKFYGGCSTSLL